MQGQEYIIKITTSHPYPTSYLRVCICVCVCVCVFVCVCVCCVCCLFPFTVKASRDRTKQYM